MHAGRPSGYHVLNFIAIDLQLYKIFKITRVSFFGRQCKGPFIATQLNSTQLDVELSCVAINGP